MGGVGSHPYRCNQQANVSQAMPSPEIKTRILNSFCMDESFLSMNIPSCRSYIGGQ
jgi:hypothetical protein